MKTSLKFCNTLDVSTSRFRHQNCKESAHIEKRAYCKISNEFGCRSEDAAGVANGVLGDRVSPEG